MQCPLFEKERFVLAISILAIFLSLYAILFFIPNKNIQKEIVYLQKPSKNANQPELYSLTSKIPLTLVSYDIEYSDGERIVSIIWKKENEASSAYFNLLSIYSNTSLFEKLSTLLINMENKYGFLYTDSIFLFNQTPVYVIYPLNESSSLTVLYLWQGKNKVYILNVISKGMEVEGYTRQIISIFNEAYTPKYSSLVELYGLLNISLQNKNLFYCVEDSSFTCFSDNFKIFSKYMSTNETLDYLNLYLSEENNSLQYITSYTCKQNSVDLYKDVEGFYYSILPIYGELSVVLISPDKNNLYYLCKYILL